MTKQHMRFLQRVDRLDGPGTGDLNLRFTS